MTEEGNSPTLKEKLRLAIRTAKQKMNEGEDEDTREEKDPDEWTKEELHHWINRNFKIDELPCLNSRAERRKVEDLLLEFRSALSISGEYGRTRLVQHEIRTGEAAPIHLPHRPINPDLEGDLLAQLKKWLHHRVIEKSTSPWSFPLVAAPKKGNKICWCIDYRRLNQVTERDSHPLPNISDNLARLSKSRVFSVMDGSGAFHVIPITKKDRPKTSFSTPFGSFQFCKLPFGLCNGPATYSRLVQLVLNGVPPQVALPYLDDTLIHSKDTTVHFHDLHTVLSAFRGAGLKLQPEKCSLFQKEVEYLGHLVGGDGV